MDKAKIYQTLFSKGANCIVIAEALGISHQSVQKVIATGKGSMRIAKAVAEICDLPLEAVFPHYKQKEIAAIQRANRQAEINKKLAKYA